ncbi:MAG TPA: LLM class flavin-dependent oxidoreductase, partial [Solirubrobacterales bacterium]|nr:LLM class flavin-dependent oxidoreductase [Solirubrobacterales bacterium]
KFHWFLPTQGDGRALIETGGTGPTGTAGGLRDSSIPYLSRIATAAEDLGFEAALTPTGGWCDDAWVVTAMLSETSERLKFLIAFRPGMVAPPLAAQMAATFQWHSGGRLLLNVVTGGDSEEQRAYGDFLGKDERYRRTGEFLEIVRRLWAGETVDFAGEHLQVEGAALHRVPDPAPQIYFGGSSPAAGEVAAEHVDVYLTWGEPPEAVAEKVAWIQALAAERGRRVRFGIRLHVIARDSAAEAWAEAERLLSTLDAETIARVQDKLQRSESVGQKRMLDLHGGSAADLEVAPNLWAGVGLGRGGAGTALVGSHEEIADRIEEYANVGIEEFVLSGYPHLEELYWFGEGVLPVLRERGLWREPGFEASARGREGNAVPFAVGAR